MLTIEFRMIKPTDMQEKNERSTLESPPPKHPAIGEWIKLKSKTHLGRPFYVHTVTGASVWNRTHAGLAKLKKNDNKPIQKVAETTVRPDNIERTETPVQPEKKGLEQNNEIGFQRQMYYQFRKPITNFQPSSETKVLPETTRGPEITVWPEQDIEIPLQRQFINNQVQNPRATARSEATVYSKPTVWSKQNNEMPLRRQINYQVYNPIPQHQAAAECTARAEAKVSPKITVWSEQNNEIPLQRQINYQVQQPNTQYQPAQGTVRPEATVRPKTTVWSDQNNEILLQRQVNYQVQEPIPCYQAAQGTARPDATGRPNTTVWSDQNNAIPLQRQVNYQVQEPIPLHQAAQGTARPEATVCPKTTVWSDQNNEILLQRQVNYQVQEPIPQYQAAQGAARPDATVRPNTTVSPNTTVWSDQNNAIPLQRQVNYQVQEPIPQYQAAQGTARPEATVHPKTTVWSDQNNAIPLQRQVNYQVQNPISQMQPDANLTHTQPYSQYEKPHLTVSIRPPNPSIIPPCQSPPILVRNYSPPPIPTPGSIYSSNYSQQQINMPIINNPVEVKATQVSLSSRFKVMAAGSDVKKTIINNATPQLELTKITPVVRPFNTKPNHQKQFNRNPTRRHTRFSRNDGVKDLREVLRAKRFNKMTKKVSFRIPEDQTAYDNGDNEGDIESQMTHLNVGNKADNQGDEAEPLYPNDQSETRLSSDNDVENTGLRNQPNLNFKQLKKEMGCSDEELWYVVADTNVFIGNCYLLKTVVNADEKCRLLVTHRVITELDGFVKHCAGNEASQMAAFSAIRFLESSSKVVTDVMLLGKLSFNVRYKNGDDQILDCIIQLSKRNYHLIFLSNDVRLINRATHSHVLTFTAPELKKILNSPNETEEKNEINTPISITFNNSCQGSPNSLDNETVLESFNKPTEIQMPRPNIADSGAQTDFSPEIIKTEISNTKTLVNRDVQTNDDSLNGDNFNNETELILTRNTNVVTEPERDSRKEKRSKWWSRRRKLEIITNSVSTSTDTTDFTKSTENCHFEAQSSHNSPQNTNVSQEQSNADSNDSFSFSRRFSGSHLISDSTQLQPMTVEESPTNSSDVISNTRSSVCSVSNVVNHRTTSNGNLESNFAGVIDGNLFDVTDRAMEERLRTGAEEWTSRFLQIMEEVLSQLLRLNPLPNNPYLPPWTVHEATVCLQEKYNNNSAIVNAAKLFSFTIFAYSDKMGNIDRTLKPERFKKLFNHGWSFISVLHQVLSGRPGSEDLAVAKDSLNKLLSDIKGFNSDAMDHFVDISAEECLKEVNVRTHQSDHMGSQGDIFQHHDTPHTRSPILQNSKRDPLLSQASKASSDYVKIIRNVNINDSDIIKSINNYNVTDRFDEDEFPETVHKITSPDHSPPPEPNKFAEGNSFSPKTPETSPPTKGNQTIIRKFTACAEFEKRLRKGNDNSNKVTHSITSSLTKANPKILSNLKKFAEFEERLRTESNNLDKDIGIKSLEGPSSGANVNKDMDVESNDSISRNTQIARPKPASFNLDMDMLSYSDDEDYGEYEAYDDNECMDEGDDDLLEEIDEIRVGDKPVKDPKVMIKTFLAEIKDSVLQVRSYCEQTYLELSNGKVIHSERRLELKEQTEDMHMFLNSLLNTLDSILLRENTSEVNIQQSRLAYFKICATQCTSYSDIIEKCSAQVKILLDVLSSILRDIIV